MGLINKILENNLLFYSIIGILLAVFVLIIYFAFFYKKSEEDSEVKEEKIEETEEQKEAKEELEKVIEQMTEDVQTKKEENIEEFENDQEENAVISYQELVNNVRSEKIDINLEDIYEEDALEEMEKKEDLNSLIEQIDKKEEEKIEIEVEQPKEEEKIEINIEPEEVEPQSNFNDAFMDSFDFNKSFEEESNYTNFSELLTEDEINEEKIIEEIKEIKEEPKEERKYKRSEIISPIYGRQNIDVSYPKIETFDRNKDFKENLIEIEKSLSEEPLTDEEKANEDFLNTLKEFRRNL